MRRLERKVGKKSLDRELFLLRSHNFNSFRFTSTSTALPANWNWFSTAEMGFCSIKFHSKMFVIKYFHNTIYIFANIVLPKSGIFIAIQLNWMQCFVWCTYRMITQMLLWPKNSQLCYWWHTLYNTFMNIWIGLCTQRVRKMYSHIIPNSHQIYCGLCVSRRDLDRRGREDDCRISLVYILRGLCVLCTVLYSTMYMVFVIPN